MRGRSFRTSPRPDVDDREGRVIAATSTRIAVVSALGMARSMSSRSRSGRPRRAGGRAKEHQDDDDSLGCATVCGLLE